MAPSLNAVAVAGRNILDSTTFGTDYIRDTQHEFDVEMGTKPMEKTFSRGDLSTEYDGEGEEEEFPSGAGMRVCFKVRPVSVPSPGICRGWAAVGYSRQGGDCTPQRL